jgi:ligand-binding sensor domain-containing protein
MRPGRITRFVAITRQIQTEAVKPSPVYAGWMSHVSQRCVRALAVAPRSSRLLAATWGGVLAWRRKEDSFYRRYSSEHGLAGNAVSGLALDAEGRVWAGHDEGGLSCLAGDGWHALDELAEEPIRCVCPDGGSGVYVATSRAVYRVPWVVPNAAPLAEGHDGAVEADALLADGDDVLLGNAWGLFRLRAGHEPEPIEPGTISSCVALARDSQGVIWVATPHEVYRWRRPRLEGPLGPPAGEGPVRILGLAAGRNLVWIATTSGLARVANSRWQSLPWRGPAPAPAVHAVAASGDDGFLWVGTDQRLAVVWLEGQEAVWDTNLLPPHPEDALNNLGRCAAGPTADGSVVVGTAGGLVTFRPDGTWRLDAGVGDVRGLYGGGARQREPDTVYLLAWPRGFGRRTGSGAVQFYSPQPDGIPLVVALGQDGYPYALTTRAFWRLRSDGPERVAEGFDGAVRHLAQTPDGAWWVGTTRGVWGCSPARCLEPTGEQSGPTEAEVTDLVVLGDTLWAATTDGLWARDGSGWQPHDVEGSKERGAVRTVAPAADPRILWLAAEDRLLRYDPAGRRVLATYTPRSSGLGSARITALREGGGVLWVVTSCGTYRLLLEQGS